VYVILGVYENQVLGTMHGVKHATENCTKVANMRGDYSSMGDRGELIQFQQQNLKGRENSCYLRVDERIILK
jgi:hypothetical protein